MRLYLMRHAEAVDLGTNGINSDEARNLTDKGCRQAKRMGRLLQRLDITMDRVLSSPFVRARQTAEIVVATANWAVQIQTAAALQPDADPDAMRAAISRVGGESVLVVGHLPSIASLADVLLGSLAEEALWFHKSSLAAWHCCEAFQDGHQRMQLEWMISPAMAKRLDAR